MLAVINKSERFTNGKYNILRIVSTYPLTVDFSSQSFQEKLPKDKHALAQIDGTTLMAEIANHSGGPSIDEWVMSALKKKQEEMQQNKKSGSKGGKRILEDTAKAGSSTRK